jgi:hypothetical protein
MKQDGFQIERREFFFDYPQSLLHLPGLRHRRYTAPSDLGYSARGVQQCGVARLKADCPRPRPSL